MKLSSILNGTAATDLLKLRQNIEQKHRDAADKARRDAEFEAALQASAAQARRALETAKAVKRNQNRPVLNLSLEAKRTMAINILVTGMIEDAKKAH